MKGFVAKMSN